MLRCSRVRLLVRRRYAMAPEDVMPLLRCQTDGMSDLEGVFIEYIYQEDEMHFWREDLYNFAQGNPCVYRLSIPGSRGSWLPPV